MSAKIPLWQRPVTYANIGATQASDLLGTPPPGFRPFRKRIRIGHGAARWEYCTTEIMSWGIQRGSGLRITVADLPAAVSDQTYVPVSRDTVISDRALSDTASEEMVAHRSDSAGFDTAGFDTAGFDTAGLDTAVEPSPAPAEVVFGPDGSAFIVPGDSVVLNIPLGPLRFSAPARVVYVVNEPSRRGFAYGTLPGHPESGEESFIVDQTDDGSVWLEISAFSRPANAFWWLGYPFLRLTQAYYTRRYFESLAGVLPRAPGA